MKRNIYHYNMKTNQIMKRPLANFTVEQRTVDGMFNATELLRQWNNPKKLNTQNIGDLKKKDIDDYLNTKSTREYIKALTEEENLNDKNPAYISVRGKYGGTWMHPLLFIDFAMWLNPTFKVKVLKFVSDQMLSYRNEAGEAYKELASAVGKVVPKRYMRKYMEHIAKGINFIIVGKHQQMIRNEYGTEEKQKEYFELEKQVAMLINDGFLKTGDEVVSYLRKKFTKKYF